ncbi:hypothetical protein WFZ85_14475 [Flavobacterium sp. j3]|uniref:Uncharacterized protein n=1 Tax=Flavobacterium aureirubrum TaxID=3133147 RepID=A0ABU9N817_9FLAO
MTNTTNKPWYKKTEFTVTLFGIIAPFLITYLINVFDKDTKQISIVYSDIDPIISESKDIVSDLKITYDSSDVENISKITFKIKNSGTLCLTKNDFIDGPININIQYLNGAKSIILQANEKENANQQNSSLVFKNKPNSSEIIYNPSLLNPKDEITIDAYILNTPNIKISSKGKILDGEILGPIPIQKKDTKIGYKSFIQSWVSLFGNEWFSIVFDIILFIILALSTIFQLSMSTERQHIEVKQLLKVMGFTTGTISVFLIIMIVSTLLYF